MKPSILPLALLLTLSPGLASCNADDPALPPQTEQPTPPGEPNDSPPMSNRLHLRIGSTTFGLTLENGAPAAALKAMFPLTINMAEMGGNEKYYYLPHNLPTASFNPGTVRTGDLMLYGSSCLVLFYETASTSYSYTRLGRVDNPSALASALGPGSVALTFELQ